MAIRHEVVYEENTSSVKLLGAVNDLTDAPIVGALVQAWIKTRQEDGTPGTDVGGVAWPIVMPDLATAGDYGAALPVEDTDVVRGEYYIVVVTLDGVDGEHGEWEHTIRIKGRTSPTVNC